MDVFVIGDAPDGSAVERTECFAIEVQPDVDDELTKPLFIALIVVVVLILLLPVFLIVRWIWRVRGGFGKKR